MAQLVITKWQCDRCGEVHDKKPQSGGQDQYAVKISCSGEWAGWTVFDWKELCHRCNSDVASALDALRYRPAVDANTGEPA